MGHKNLFMLFFFAWFSVASAQTSGPVSDLFDYENPCSQLQSATSGLYGLCMSYCESLNCDESDDESAACQSTLEAYNRKRKPEDPLMPCAGCPCFTKNDVESVVSHRDFFYCGDYYEEEVRGTYYSSFQELKGAGSFDENGDAQVGRSLYVVENDPQWPGFSCDWLFEDIKPVRDIQVHWDGNPLIAEDVSKFEQCRSIFDSVIETENISCETVPSCQFRVVLDWPYNHEGSTIEIDGHLINDPPLDCLNRDSIVRVDWYWGDGYMDTFYQMADGYVHPFPNSHTYTENGLFVWRLYAFNVDGKLLGGAGNMVLIVGL